MRRPCVARAASRCWTPKRVSRSRCSTRMADTYRSASSRRTLRRLPFRPEPTSVTTPCTGSPPAVAHAVTRATYRSKSARWSWEETRAYTTLRPVATSDQTADPPECSPRGRLVCRHGQTALLPPAPSGDVGDALPAGPVRQLHRPSITHILRRHDYNLVRSWLPLAVRSPEPGLNLPGQIHPAWFDGSSARALL